MAGFQLSTNGRICVSTEACRRPQWNLDGHAVPVMRPDVGAVELAANSETAAVRRVATPIGVQRQVIFPGYNERAAPVVQRGPSSITMPVRLLPPP